MPSSSSKLCNIQLSYKGYNSIDKYTYTVTHDILNTKIKNDESMIVDKVGKYSIENYIYMIFFYLLSYIP